LNSDRAQGFSRDHCFGAASGAGSGGSDCFNSSKSMRFALSLQWLYKSESKAIVERAPLGPAGGKGQRGILIDAIIRGDLEDQEEPMKKEPALSQATSAS